MLKLGMSGTRRQQRFLYVVNQSVNFMTSQMQIHMTY